MIKFLFLLPIKFYRRFISPLLGQNCRYTPTCSKFALDAIEEWGVIKGGWLATKRIASCHPWGGHGHDPVPTKKGTAKPELSDGLVSPSNQEK